MPFWHKKKKATPSYTIRQSSTDFATLEESGAFDSTDLHGGDKQARAPSAKEQQRFAVMLTTIYKVVAPHKVAEAPNLASRYAHDQEHVFKLLEWKYGARVPEIRKRLLAGRSMDSIIAAQGQVVSPLDEATAERLEQLAMDMAARISLTLKPAIVEVKELKGTRPFIEGLAVIEAALAELKAVEMSSGTLVVAETKNEVMSSVIRGVVAHLETSGDWDTFEERLARIDVRIGVKAMAAVHQHAEALKMDTVLSKKEDSSFGGSPDGPAAAEGFPVVAGNLDEVFNHVVPFVVIADALDFSYTDSSSTETLLDELADAGDLWLDAVAVSIIPWQRCFNHRQWNFLGGVPKLLQRRLLFDGEDEVPVKRLEGVHLTDATIITLAPSCPHLQYLDVNDTEGNVTDESIEFVAERCPRLRELHVRNTGNKVTAAAIIAVAERCNDLQVLDISSNAGSITDAAIQALAEHCRRLFSLRVDGTAISDTAVETLEKRNPMLTVFK